MRRAQTKNRVGGEVEKTLNYHKTAENSLWKGKFLGIELLFFVLAERVI